MDSITWMENTKENTIMSYDQKELQMGTSIEHEHTQDDRLAAKIAADHLREDPHYYSKLNKAGLAQEEVAPLQSDNLGSDLDECGADVAVIKIDAVSTGPKKTGGEAQPAKPLTSSNLASGTPRPLTSDTLQAPKGDNTVGVGKTPPKMGGKDSSNGDLNVKGTKLKDEEGNSKPNNISYGKTPSMPGTNSNSDPTDFFAKQISKALKPESPRSMEFIPANVSEGGSSLKKK